MKADPAPSTAPREWTIDVCDECGDYGCSHRDPRTKELRPGRLVKVVERASLDRVVEERERMREAIGSALGYISADIDGCDGEDQAYRICIELRAALRSGEGGTA